MRWVPGVETTRVSEKKTNNKTGIPIVKSNVSPRRIVIATSARV
jgi:hypothetical protein